MKPAMLAVVAALLAAAQLAPARAETPAWQVELGAGTERLSNGSPDWRQVDFTLRRRHAAGGAGELGLRRVERYGRSDGELSAGAAWPIAPDWSLALRAAASDGRFLARLGGQADLSRRLDGGWVLGAGVGRSLYDPEGGVASGTSSLRATVERYVGAWRFAAGASRARLDGGESASALRLQIDHYVTDSARVGLLVARGDELEYDTLGVLASRVEAVALVGRWALVPGWALAGELSRTTVRDTVRRGGPPGGSSAVGYRRSGGRLALQRDF
jgi:YaiO family outer membrane protein